MNLFCLQQKENYIRVAKWQLPFKKNMFQGALQKY